MPSPPHYLLFSQAAGYDGSGQWRFVLRSADGASQFEAADVEPRERGERLDLLTVVRALESLDQPSRVTLVECSRYVRQGMQYGLLEWRNNGWRWESFGRFVPVKNGDLWQRMDRALRFHQVECRQRRFDPPHLPAAQPRAAERVASGAAASPRRIRVSQPRRVGYWAWLLLPRRSQRGFSVLRSWRRRVVRSWTALKPGLPAA